MMVSDPIESASQKRAEVLGLNGGILQLERRGEHASLVTTQLLEPPGSAAGQPIMSDQSWPWGEEGCGLALSKARISWAYVSSPSGLCRSPDSSLSELHEKRSETSEQKLQAGIAHSRIMASAGALAALLDKKGGEKFDDTDVPGRDAPLAFAFSSEAGRVGRLPGEDKNESSEVGGGFAEEDIDDLEVILGFRDDEEEEAEDRSSASVPSESISHFGPPPPSVAARKTFSGELFSRRKRPCACEKLHDEHEVESRFTKRRRSSEREPLDIFTSKCGSSAYVSIAGTISGESSHGQPLSHEQKSDEGENEDDCDFDESTDELHMLCDDFGYVSPEQQCSSCSKEGGGHSVVSGSARQSRKQKIKETVKMLREAIPGGSCMDTSIVLDEAIHYVKLLQLQVQTLGAKRFELDQRAIT